MRLALALLLLASCVEIAPPMSYRPVSGGQGESAEGGGGSGGSVGIGGAGGAPDAPLPVCTEAMTEPCARPMRLEAGGFHTCAAMSDETVRCWGSNDSGQLGDPDEPLAPEAWGILEGVSADDMLTLGMRHGCAVVDGRAGCWGRNSLGQLGTGDGVFHAAFHGVVDAMAVAGSNDTSCAIDLAGTVFCWGVRLDGQGWEAHDVGASWPQPVAVPGLATPVALSVGSRHACAIRADRLGVDCWGDGIVGQIGHGSFDDATIPTAVLDLAVPVTQIVAAADGGCTVGGTPPVVQCWGTLPRIDQVVAVATAVEPQPAGEVVRLEAGWRHACALLVDGRVVCWGLDAHGALGRGEGHSAAPKEVKGVENAIDLASGRNHNCALREDGVVLCWGRNDFGQLGRDTLGLDDAAAARVVWPW